MVLRERSVRGSGGWGLEPSPRSTSLDCKVPYMLCIYMGASPLPFIGFPPPEDQQTGKGGTDTARLCAAKDADSKDDS
jgi:hypothetical protein